MYLFFLFTFCQYNKDTFVEVEN